MKIIHTADNHLDMPLSSLPLEKATARKRERLSAFTKIIDHTIAVNADMLLISGDLFDSSNPSDALLSYCASEFEKLGNTPVFLSLGNHDYGIKRDVFPGNVHIFPNTLTAFTSQGAFCFVFKYCLYGNIFSRNITFVFVFKHFLIESVVIFSKSELIFLSFIEG